ncbi:hypothetical protein [Corynebacterium anserum]|uniref:Uncharacterized protein n=1 Tax=Corynebacterium anserum TaxID=2684406 RepID=A0A7G7YNA7_9CORY|nr:hypothetical protein [Corynebacterium anserum]QNH95977.1 hypothetical protein GP473_04195 [Corynebacterium anserum]
MSPQTIFFSRIMRIVVLLFFTIYLLMSANSWVNYLFSAVCILFLLTTVWQLWATYKRDGGLP